MGGLAVFKYGIAIGLDWGLGKRRYYIASTEKLEKIGDITTQFFDLRVYKSDIYLFFWAGGRGIFSDAASV